MHVELVRALEGGERARADFLRAPEQERSLFLEPRVAVERERGGPIASVQAQEAVATADENLISSLLAGNLAKAALARAIGARSCSAAGCGTPAESRAGRPGSSGAPPSRSSIARTTAASRSSVGVVDIGPRV